MIENGTVNFRGKTYQLVGYRVSKFRAEYSISDGWAILTDILEMSDDRVLIQAKIVDPDGRIVATGHAEETRTSRGVNSTSALENGETSAVGRALANAGMGGTEFATADELANALHQQNHRKPKPNPKPPQPTRDKDFNPRAFGAQLSELGLVYNDVAEYCQSKNWGRPSAWTQQRRNSFIDSIKSGKLKIGGSDE